jgi:hypothetical protein
MKASKKTEVTIVMDIHDAMVLIDVLGVVARGERQILDDIEGDSVGNLGILEMFLAETRRLV